MLEAASLERRHMCGVGGRPKAGKTASRAVNAAGTTLLTPRCIRGACHARCSIWTNVIGGVKAASQHSGESLRSPSLVFYDWHRSGL